MKNQEFVKHVTNELWRFSDELRGKFSSFEILSKIEYLVFLNRKTLQFMNYHDELSQIEFADTEDPDEYHAEGILYLTDRARWNYIYEHRMDDKIAEHLQSAFTDIMLYNVGYKEVFNIPFEPNLKGSYTRLIELIHEIDLKEVTNIDKSKGLLLSILSNELMRHPTKLGEDLRHFTTPKWIKNLMVKLLNPKKGRIYDPCFGTAGFLTEVIDNVNYNQRRNFSFYGQEMNNDVFNYAKIVLSNYDLAGDFGLALGDTLHNDQYYNLKADYVFANPPFNQKLNQELDPEDIRWQYGAVQSINTNFAWLQVVLHHLSVNGFGAIILNEGALFQGGYNGRIRKAILKADLVEAVISLPTSRFVQTRIGFSIWILSKNKSYPKNSRPRNYEILFINASNMGERKSRTSKGLTKEIEDIVSIYNGWKFNSNIIPSKFTDLACASTLNEVEENNYLLKPSLYVSDYNFMDEIENVSKSLPEVIEKIVQEEKVSSLLTKEILDLLEDLPHG